MVHNCSRIHHWLFGNENPISCALILCRTVLSNFSLALQRGVSFFFCHHAMHHDGEKEFNHITLFFTNSFLKNTINGSPLACTLVYCVYIRTSACTPFAELPRPFLSHPAEMPENHLFLLNISHIYMADCSQ